MIADVNSNLKARSRRLGYGCGHTEPLITEQNKVLAELTRIVKETARSVRLKQKENHPVPTGDG
jgi:hypothetical protein